MRAIYNVILDALFIETALAECKTGENDEELLFAARNYGEPSLHIDKMGVISRKIVKDSGGGIDKGDSLLMSVLVIVDSVELIVHDADKVADNESMFRKRFTAMNGVTHCFDQAKDMETDST